MVKKIMSFVITALILFLNTVCCAEILTKSPFEGFDGYKYDKIDKSWDYQNNWYHEYRDAVVCFGITVSGGTREQSAPRLYCFIRSADNRSMLYKLTKITFLLNDKTIYRFNDIFSFDFEMYSLTYLGEGSKEFLKDFANAKSITVRFSSGLKNFDETLSMSDLRVKRLQETARNLLSVNIWQYLNEENLNFANREDYVPEKE